MSDKLRLNCWILGNHLGSVFPVHISSSQTVGILKKKIKKEVHPELDDHPTHLLDLWKVSSRALLSPRSQRVHINADDPTFWKDDLNLGTFDLGIVDEGYLKGLEVNVGAHGEHGLKGWEQLSEVFSDSPKDKHLHIIVHRSGECKCLLTTADLTTFHHGSCRQDLKRKRQPPSTFSMSATIQ
jgi:hypothetical protein